MSSSYEPFRSHPQRDGDVDEASEKLIAPDAHERNANNIRLQRDKPAHGKATRGKHARVGLRVIALIIAITILGVQVHSASVWLSTRNQYFFNNTTKLNTRSWAIIDGWPTWVMIAAAVVATVIQLSALTSHLCVCLVDRHGSRLHAVSVYITSAILIAFWIPAMVYFKLANSQGKQKSMWDIWTWSCHEQNVKGTIPWKALCVEQKYTWSASIVVVVIEILVLILFIYNRRGLKSVQAGKGRFSLIPSWGR
ncbi:uncharacterized protein A1O9_11996 [Exophiala aquamarina CBS 119918]|uniref:MARVEL domain-containing protein n=1 Tax=Exophiala aquamarina CBS 119918 TaxID=1182545 RepID=A0A072NWK8_9EURO|nr:uncharacterized protein A1O9_11996 [Exophiala aquamarina CBS 119918]KEF52006.1 hypothetical protein A1O9_11996 [Exophiala aquamarina CBS 119918]